MGSVFHIPAHKQTEKDKQPSQTHTYKPTHGGRPEKTLNAYIQDVLKKENQK